MRRDKQHSCLTQRLGSKRGHKALLEKFTAVRKLFSIKKSNWIENFRFLYLYASFSNPGALCRL